ncbi:MAG: hypothetical protein EOP48_31675, partial [Sphingobacteriales bacterium]
MSSKRGSGLDHGIIQELSAGQDSRNLLASLRKFLSPSTSKNFSQKLLLHDEDDILGNNLLKSDRKSHHHHEEDIDLSLIEEKKEEINRSRFSDKLLSDSFLIEGNDDIKDFLISK